MDCSIAFKFGTEFHRVTGDTLQLNVQSQRSKVKVTGSKVKARRKVMYQQQKRYNTAIGWVQ